MTASQSARGRIREVKVAQLLETRGWVCVRAAMGPIDVLSVAGEAAEHPVFGLAVDPNELFSELLGAPHMTLYPLKWKPMLIQVKSSAAGPYAHFNPEERRILSSVAQKAGCPAWLAYWPPNKPLRWISRSDWPSTNG